MKKTILAIVAVFAMVFTANAQDGKFEVGINGALPVGDAGDAYTFSVGLDAAYLWNVSDKFDAGVATGFTNAFGDEFSVAGITFEVEDAQFIPLAGTARYNVSSDFFLGADLGYAIGINDGNDGGFYYRPKVGYNVSEKVSLNLSYTGISVDGGSFDTIGLGVMFGL
ncbi:outer membrane protein with beta-barrel domain [Kordia periserrulae]|uniref:Outer membrane protein with beta-barrel domain n=1 Tax=Kordia periserrulae TaxID=701523 RepID=A0A2T6C2U9_9FLAO|nr:outer membrane beta-barrel protein [Kordia periserrulae]PTX62645.1 outer membrane protein with beta-barrel domain [Kordia periserrulae]